MARIKVRLIMNKGRHRAAMAKLGKISEQAEKFLKLLAVCQDPQLLERELSFLLDEDKRAA